jgi:hypothetical protein
MTAFDKPLYATRQDQLPNLLRLEAQVKLQYVLEGMFESPEPTVYSSVAELPDLGSVEYPDYNHTPSYLVTRAGKRIAVQEEPQRAGGVLYAIDLRRNRTAFAFQPAGRFDARTLIPGSVGTATGSKTSLTLCQEFWRALRKGYVKVGRYYVGPEAYQFLQQGGRLTPAVQCPPDMDVRV